MQINAKLRQEKESLATEFNKASVCNQNMNREIEELKESVNSAHNLIQAQVCLFC